MSDVRLSELRAFAAVAQQRSFQRAADAQGVTRTALSHALRSLERRLGVRLLHRTTRSVATTEAGAQLLQRLAPMLRELEVTLDSVRHGKDEVVGTLRINSNEAGARWLLRHAVPRLQRSHPRVLLDLLIDGRLVDIVAEGFDAGVRLAEAVPQDMVAIPFGGDVRFIAVAAPVYVERSGRPLTPSDLQRHRCILQRLPSGKPYRWELSRGAKNVAIKVEGSLCLNDSALMVEAAVQGMGIAYVPESFARQALADGQLVELLEDWTPPAPGLCLYYASHRNVPTVLRSFIKVLREANRTNARPRG